MSDGEDGRLLAFCFGGCEFNEIMLALVEYGLLDDDDGDDSHVSRRVIVCPRDDAERIAHARQIYDSGVWDERIAVYLRSRGIGLTSPVLRFQEQAPHRLGARLPAMLAPVVDVTGEQIGVHLTYLRRDGGGKATLPKEYQRECRGVIHGGAIRLAEHDPDAELIVAEGIESTFSAMQLFGRAGWAAVYAGGLKTSSSPRPFAPSSSPRTTMRAAPGSATPWPRTTDGPPRAARCGSRSRLTLATISTTC